MNKVGIIGLGLIGGSLGLAINKYIPELSVLGFDKNIKYVDYSCERGIIDDVLTKEDMKTIDLMFIAVPVKSVISVVDEIYPFISIDKTIVTDVGSTKSFLNAEIASRYPDLNYIGGHPIAGREVSGPEGALADLFRDKKYVLIKENYEENKSKSSIGIDSSYKLLASLLTKIGCEVIELKADQHDKFLAFTSHLPQIVASGLVNELVMVEEQLPPIINFIGSGFKDTTRIAASDPEMWLDIFLTNKNNVLARLDGFIDQLLKFKSALQSDNKEYINEFMINSQKERKKLEGESL